MNFHVGSTNQVKIDAVRETLQKYPGFIHAHVTGLSVSSGVSEQPLTLNETVCGAKNRAENAFKNCTYSIGIESGLQKIDSVFMDFCMCSIYDGTEHHLGKSCGFVLPKQISNLVFNKKLDLNQATFQAGLTDDPQIGSSKGLIGLLTKGRINRKESIIQALITALISIEQRIKVEKEILELNYVS